jgi:hypothetical protein
MHKENTMSNRHLIGRRQFLIVSSTFAVAAATVGPKLFAGEIASQPKRLAVGFASFEENAAIVDAWSVPTGDGKFIGRGARIVASGASGASADPRQRRAVELLAHYSYLDGAERLTTPFVAWACSRVTGCQGNGVGFTVPVDEVQKIAFTVGVQTGTPSVAASRRAALTMDTIESTPLPLTLSLQNEAGTVKLARGFYVVVPMFENDRAPSWSSWQLGIVDGRRTLVDRDGNAAPFEHFVLKIDYAD